MILVGVVGFIVVPLILVTVVVALAQQQQRRVPPLLAVGVGRSSVDFEWPGTEAEFDAIVADWAKREGAWRARDEGEGRAFEKDEHTGQSRAMPPFHTMIRIVVCDEGPAGRPVHIRPVHIEGWVRILGEIRGPWPEELDLNVGGTSTPYNAPSHLGRFTMDNLLKALGQAPLWVRPHVS